ncbi:MAG: hypothetical protein ABI838_09200 [Chloroflexota bacterium]
MYDEPLALAEIARGHYASCAGCQDRFSAIAEDARQMSAALAVPGVTVDAAAAHRALQPRLQPQPRFALRLPSMNYGFVRRTGLVVALAATLVVVLAATPIAETFLDLISPTTVTTVTVSQSSLAGFPDLSHWGDFKVTQQPELKQADTAAAAHDATGLPVIGGAPAGLPAPQFATLTQGSGSFTFSKAKAAAYAASQNQKAPPLPDNLDGARLDVTLGPAEVALYGGDLAAIVRQGTKTDGTPPADKSSLVPQLAVAITKAPKLTSTKASVADIKNAIASQPGVSPELKKTILALGDPNNSALPIPVLDGMTVSHTGNLHDGTKYVYEGDTTLGGVIFIRGGNIYVAAGSLSEAQLLEIANNL